MPERKRKHSTIFPGGVRIEIRITSGASETTSLTKTALKAAVTNIVPNALLVESQILSKLTPPDGMVAMNFMVFETPESKVVEKVQTDASTA